MRGRPFIHYHIGHFEVPVWVVTVLFPVFFAATLAVIEASRTLLLATPFALVTLGLAIFRLVGQKRVRPRPMRFFYNPKKEGGEQK